jgi:hypothetical protein
MFFKIENKIVIFQNKIIQEQNNVAGILISFFVVFVVVQYTSK